MYWKQGASEGKVVAGGNGQGDALNQLMATDFCLDKDSKGKTIGFYIADAQNKRILHWELGATEGEVVESDIDVAFLYKDTNTDGTTRGL
eukprot:CAMPEP_0116907106 /NCGR_PEP_ID=MMETSP0467-20121206/12909_1 /TAXON_ID=283647 /ORGANISM="Mesodinium pulex, Strain SPMC105" /LENGTH=89 /DNA_ID=CAMNT_0004582063 /DNA_START=1161 /DNA_END=1430 /DNA_ORIENTATION=+